MPEVWGCAGEDVVSVSNPGYRGILYALAGEVGVPPGVVEFGLELGVWDGGGICCEGGDGDAGDVAGEGQGVGAGCGVGDEDADGEGGGAVAVGVGCGIHGNAERGAQDVAAGVERCCGRCVKAGHGNGSGPGIIGNIAGIDAVASENGVGGECVQQREFGGIAGVGQVCGAGRSASLDEDGVGLVVSVAGC